MVGGMPRMPPFEGVGRAAAAAAAPPPPPLPPPPLHPPVVLADMVMVGWVGICIVGKVMVLVDAMVSPGVRVL